MKFIGTVIIANLFTQGAWAQACIWPVYIQSCTCDALINQFASDEPDVSMTLAVCNQDFKLTSVRNGVHPGIRYLITA
jgi:hypothetical protein